MWVTPEVGGRGISRAILTAIEVQAQKENVRWLKLETGVESHAALALYGQVGFERCCPFGDYRADPLSVFMQKDLSKNP
jgi:putative acetyltransferase